MYMPVINDEMKLAVTHAFGTPGQGTGSAGGPENIRSEVALVRTRIPDSKPSDPRLLAVVATAVARAAIESGVARREIEDWDAYAASLTRRVKNTK